nr:MAG TPA: hypothetical protein [Caudoviricetes sp.]
MADMTYIKLFVDYLDAIEPLGDAVGLLPYKE